MTARSTVVQDTDPITFVMVIIEPTAETGNVLYIPQQDIRQGDGTVMLHSYCQLTQQAQLAYHVCCIHLVLPTTT